MCPAPLINLHFSQLGIVTACCFNRTLVLGTYPKDSVDQIWNGAPARELREALANNDLSKGCEKCLQQIEARDFGGSHAVFYTIFARAMAERQKALGIAPDFDQSVRPMPMKLEFNIHNSCNLECIMCHGLASSSIARRREAMPAMENPYDDAFVDQLEQFLPHVVEADFMGGEPFLVPAYRRLWERIARVNPKTKVLILTNGTILDDEIEELLRRLNVSMHMSIDSDVKETYERIRRNASYDEVMRHADFYRELMEHTGHPLVWRYCPMRINWREMPQTVRNCNEKGIILHFNQLDSPINFSLTTMPRNELEEVVRFLEDNGPSDPTNGIQRCNQVNWEEMVHRFRGFLDPGNRRNGLVSRLDTAAAVVNQYTERRTDGRLKRRLPVAESQTALTEAAKSYIITRLNVDQAISTEGEVGGDILERLQRRAAELAEASADVAPSTFARIFLTETVRTYSGVWGVYQVHDDRTFDRIDEFSSWVGTLFDPKRAMAEIVQTPPSELYRLIGLTPSLVEAKAKFWNESPAATLVRKRWETHQTLGDSLMREARWDEAAAEYELAITADPSAVPSYVSRGHALCHLQHWDEAVDAYVRARELDGSVGGVCSNLGDALLRLERWEEAVSVYRAAIEEAPDAAACHVNLGHAYAHLGRCDDAVAAYRRAFELRPEDATPLHNVADALSRDSRWSEAADAYREAIARRPGVVQSLVNLGHVLAHQALWSEAAFAYATALQQEPTISGIRELVDDALARAVSARAARPRAAPEPAPEPESRPEGVLGPSSALGEAGSDESLGDALSGASRHEEALAPYWRAIRERPGDPSLHVKLGTALAQLHRSEEALAVFRKALHLSPESVSMLIGLGDAFWRLNRLEDAIAAYREGVRREPQSASLHARLGEALGAAERWEEAVAAYREAIAREPGTASFHTRLGQALGCANRWDEAVAAYRKAAQADPSSPDARRILADALASASRWEEAVGAYAEAIEHDLGRTPNAAAIAAASEGPVAVAQGISLSYRKLGDALLKLKRWEHAAAAHARADALNPAWSRAPIGQIAPRVERWIESGWKAASAAASSGARTMFVLDSDYGELTTVMFLLFGQEAAARATIVLSERLYVVNRDALPVNTRAASSVEDIERAIEEERPDIVFLCSGYLFSIHALMSLDALEGLSQFVRKRGARLVTTDPFLGLLDGIGTTTTVSIDIPPNSPPALVRAKEEQDQRLLSHFSRSNRILRNAPHLYPTYPAAIDAEPPLDPRVLSFFNANLRYGAEESAARSEPGERPRWLFVLASRDYEAQIMFHGKDHFVGVVIAKIRETLAAGRHPVFVAPYDLVQAVIARMEPTPGVTLLTFCPFKRFLALLADAEFAFYWNVVSHSMLLRLMNGQPVFMFDRGHLVRNVSSLYERIVGWYYQGREPMYLEPDLPLDPGALGTLARSSLHEWEKVAAGFARAPSPAQLLSHIVGDGTQRDRDPRASGAHEDLAMRD